MKIKQKCLINEHEAVQKKVQEVTNEYLLTIDELSEWLSIEKSTIYAWTSKKIIPHIKLGKKILRFRVNEILDWLSKKSVSPDTEVANQVEKQHKVSAKSSASYDYVDRIIKGVKTDVLRN
jgi:excisionase family DNA binding protein